MLGHSTKSHVSLCESFLYSLFLRSSSVSYAGTFTLPGRNSACVHSRAPPAESQVRHPGRQFRLGLVRAALGRHLRSNQGRLPSASLFLLVFPPVQTVVSPRVSRLVSPICKQPQGFGHSLALSLAGELSGTIDVLSLTPWFFVSSRPRFYLFVLFY